MKALMLVILAITIISFCLVQGQSNNGYPPVMDVMEIRAVIGRDAIIPCGQKKIFLDGPEAYVSWMKNDKEMIYRFPLNTNNEEGYSSSNELCYKSPETGPCRSRTSLFLPRVSDADSAQYRCRIHYQGSPSIDYSFHLVIVDKPGFPTVYDEDGNTMTNTFIGPIALGTNVTLICEVKDGRSNTIVYWEKEGELVGHSTQISPTLKRSILQIINTTRNEHESRYSCIAQAGDVTDPLKNTLEIRMYLPPLSITINLNDQYDFEAGSPRVVDCIIIGSVPAPTIEWYLDSTRLKTYSHTESPGFNVTLSSMTFTPKRSDDNRILSCRATNHYFKETFSSSVRLVVGYKPLCAQTLKQKLDIKSDKIKKIICVVDAVPPPLVFTWNFSDYKSVETPVEATDIPFRFKSVLSWIPHDEDIGQLSCGSVNYHGKQEEPCFFDLRNKVPDCEQTGCKDGILGGPPRIRPIERTTVAPKKEQNGRIAGMPPMLKSLETPPSSPKPAVEEDEARLQPLQGVFLFVVIIILAVGLVSFVIYIIICRRLCRYKTDTSDTSNTELDAETASTYYRGVELEPQNYPKSNTVVYTNMCPSCPPNQVINPKGLSKVSSATGQSPVFAGCAGSVGSVACAYEEPSVNGYAAPALGECAIHTFYV